MKYILKEKTEATQIVCNHPKVKKIWVWGGSSMNPSSSVSINVSLLLDNDERVDFGDKDYDNVIEKAERYLEAL